MPPAMATYIIAQLQAELNKEPNLDKIQISRALVQLIIANLEVLAAMDAKKTACKTGHHSSSSALSW